MLTHEGWDAGGGNIVRRKRAVLHNAVELELLDSNPVGKVQWRAPQVAATVDRRIVANPDQVGSLLAAVGTRGERGERLRAFFGTLYYAALRPAEAIALRGGSCVLPGEGWGRLVVSESAPAAPCRTARTPLCGGHLARLG